jgi:hypothetical protein
MEKTNKVFAVKGFVIDKDGVRIRLSGITEYRRLSAEDPECTCVYQLGASYGSTIECSVEEFDAAIADGKESK